MPDIIHNYKMPKRCETSTEHEPEFIKTQFTAINTTLSLPPPDVLSFTAYFDPDITSVQTSNDLSTSTLNVPANNSWAVLALTGQNGPFNGIAKTTCKDWKLNAGAPSFQPKCEKAVVEVEVDLSLGIGFQNPLITIPGYIGFQALSSGFYMSNIDVEIAIVSSKHQPTLIEAVDHVQRLRIPLTIDANNGYTNLPSFQYTMTNISPFLPTTVSDIVSVKKKSRNLCYV